MRILLLLLFLLSSQASAQSLILDSLQQAYKTSRDEQTRVEALCGISKEYMLTDAKKAGVYAQQAHSLAVTNNYVHGQIEALNLQGYSFLVLGEYNKAIASHLKALDLSEQTRDTVGLIESHFQLGGVYKSIKDLKRAKQHLILGYNLAERIHDQLSLGKITNTLGAVHELSKEYNQAMVAYQKSADIAEDLGNKKGLAVALLNKGNLYLFTNDPLSGLPFLFKSLRLNDEVKNDMIKVPILVSIASLYAASDKNNEALSYAQQALLVAEKTGSNKKIVAATQLLQKVYASLGQYSQAYKTLSVYSHYDSIMAADSQKKAIEEISAKHETEKKEFENRILKRDKQKKEQEIKQQRAVIAIVGIMLVLVLVELMLLIKSRHRIASTYAKLQAAHEQTQVQHQQIQKQKEELEEKSLLLQHQNNQLENHAQFKDKVFTVISHDLRGPFFSLKGILSITDRKVLKEEDVKYIFELLDKEADIALNLLNNLLNWSKTQIAEEHLQYQKVDLQLLAEENIQLVSLAATQKHIVIKNDIAPELEAYTDRERLNFVFRNLIMNAVKFTSSGGEIILSGELTEEHIHLSVADTGSGISERNLVKLLTDQRFTTLGTSEEKGTGLGLMLSKEFISNLQGSLSVTSEEGKGSTFTIKIPVKPEQIAIKKTLKEVTTEAMAV